MKAFQLKTKLPSGVIHGEASHLIMLGVVMGLAISFSLLTPTPVLAATCSGPYCTDGGSGHDVPVPFETNAHVELADGEYYALSGKVVMGPSLSWDSSTPQAYLQIDLAEYPWLANPTREASPLYALEGSTKLWRKVDSKSVTMVFKAHGRVISPDGGRTQQYVIFLEPKENLGSEPREVPQALSH